MAVSEKMVEAAMVATHGKNWRKASRGWAIGAEATMRRALEAAEAVQKQIHGISAETLAKAAAVRGGDAAPPAGTVPVRVAVAFDEDGGAHVWEIDGPLGKEGAWARLRTLRGAPLRSCIATIHAPLPAVPEVGAVVEGVDRG